MTGGRGPNPSRDPLFRAKVGPDRLVVPVRKCSARGDHIVSLPITFTYGGDCPTSFRKPEWLSWIVAADTGAAMSVAMKSPHWWPGLSPRFGQVEVPTLGSDPPPTTGSGRL